MALPSCLFGGCDVEDASKTMVNNSATNGAGVVYFGANFDDLTAVTVNTNDVIKVTPRWVYTG